MSPNRTQPVAALSPDTRRNLHARPPCPHQKLIRPLSSNGLPKEVRRLNLRPTNIINSSPTEMSRAKARTSRNRDFSKPNSNPFVLQVLRCTARRKNRSRTTKFSSKTVERPNRQHIIKGTDTLEVENVAVWTSKSMSKTASRRIHLLFTRHRCP